MEKEWCSLGHCATGNFSWRELSKLSRKVLVRMAQGSIREWAKGWRTWMMEIQHVLSPGRLSSSRANMPSNHIVIAKLDYARCGSMVVHGVMCLHHAQHSLGTQQQACCMWLPPFQKAGNSQVNQSWSSKSFRIYRYKQNVLETVVSFKSEILLFEV